ncbi:MAG: HEPN domain-containing protein [Candidatus Jordarchaeales archaeon]|nr:HEPN domain-containing protein [Candidatus Jordarchaeia archaeon]
MNTEVMAKDYLKRAERCLLESEHALLDGDYPMTVRRAQECVELSLKAALRAFTIEYPKRHDVGDALPLIRDKVPDWFSSKIPQLSATSSDLARKRGPAMYGYESELKPASEIFGKNDAEEAFNSAKETFALCKRLIEELFNKKPKSSTTRNIDPDPKLNMALPSSKK